MATDRALLLIADIGGYTRFIKVHRINLAHAHYMVAQLLESLIDALGRGWKLAKLEGDAAFVYKRAPSDQVGSEARQQVVDMVRSFRRRRRDLFEHRACNCDGCEQVGKLTIKFVAHEGEVDFVKVKRSVELAGMAVITVHRLLKNSVPLDEYLLVSDRLRDDLDDDLRQAAVELREELEGVGELDTYYVDVGMLGEVDPGPVQPSRARRISNWFHMTVKALPEMVGIRKPQIDAEAMAVICGGDADESPVG